MISLWRVTDNFFNILFQFNSIQFIYFTYTKINYNSSLGNLISRVRSDWSPKEAEPVTRWFLYWKQQQIQLEYSSEVQSLP